MRKTFYAITIAITISATGVTTYIATLSNPTEAQIALANATARIATTGANTLIECAGRSQYRNKDDRNKN